MDEEDEICRVCRSEATLEQPLFHPCKCSGSIRYVHQDCLIEWLSHSGKRYCELCEHPFTFTPVYRQDMPDVIPAKLLFLRLFKKMNIGLLMASRAILVSFSWLIVLPYFTIWIWRLYFFLGTNLSQHLTKLQQLKHSFDFSKNLTTTTTVENWLEEYKSEFTLRLFLSDCFKGQLIDCIIFVIFVAVFLFREWIVQNIPAEQPPPPNPAIIIEQREMPQPAQFQDLFEFEQGPPSPVAEEQPFFPDELQQNRRATSLPPSLPSYEQSNDLVNDRRAMSVEPSFHTGHEIQHGQPPNAPRIRHAEAPHHLRPIPEEEHIPVVPNILEDEDEENVEEFEGILEAIGMQGSLWTLLQNSVLMGLLIALSLGAAVWMPYLIGMLFIITDIVDLVRIPLTLTRLITDPLVDFLFLICTDYIGPLVIGFYQHLAPLSIFQPISYLFTQHQSATVNTQLNDTSLVTSVAKFINETEPFVESAFHRYQSLASGQTTVDRVGCITVGYIIITAVYCWFLSRTSNNTSAFGRTARESIRTHGMIFKVGLFITIELALFPLACGYLLDFCTIPLFSAASITGRIISTRDHPVPSIFLHWFFGTSFMFTFAVLVSVCRDVVRPGVMWFISDPNDPEFHPIREIVERPFMFQVKRIARSALIYVMVIIIGVGGVVYLIDRQVIGFLPLRWSLSNSLSVLPIDLIVMQVGLPALVRYTRPKQTMKRIFVKWVGITCRQLRLSSFMLGGRHPEEEGRLMYDSWSAWIRRVKPSRYPDEGTIDNIIDEQVSYIWEGQLLKVPRHDSVRVVGHRRMLVPLDNYTLEPLDMMERQLGHPAARAPGGDELNTTIVYSPPHFKQRLWFFVGFMWISVTLFFCGVTMAPIMLGRYLFTHVLAVENDVHDMYSFVVGSSIILGVDIVFSQLTKSLKEVVSQPTIRAMLTTTWAQMKQWGSWGIRWTFFVITFGLIIPMMLGVLIELYFVMPMKQLSEESPSMEVLPIWAHGFVSMNVLHGFIQIFTNNPIREIIENVFRGGIHQMKLVLCIKKILTPLFVMSLAAIGFPFITAYINMKITALTNPELRIKIVQIAYPIALVGIAAYYLIRLGSRLGTRMVQNIREDNYLIGRTLHNLE